MVPLNLPVPVLSKFLLLLQESFPESAGKIQKKESTVGSSIPATEWTPPSNQARWERRPGQLAGQDHPLGAEQPVTEQMFPAQQLCLEGEGKHGCLPRTAVPICGCYQLAWPPPIAPIAPALLAADLPAPGSFSVDLCCWQLQAVENWLLCRRKPLGQMRTPKGFRELSG